MGAQRCNAAVPGPSIRTAAVQNLAGCSPCLQRAVQGSQNILMLLTVGKHGNQVDVFNVKHESWFPWCRADLSIQENPFCRGYQGSLVQSSCVWDILLFCFTREQQK